MPAPAIPTAMRDKKPRPRRSRPPCARTVTDCGRYFSPANVPDGNRPSALRDAMDRSACIETPVSTATYPPTVNPPIVGQTTPSSRAAV
ncbi:MAG: hypothetical protein QOI01_1627 [Mycobacterium sp.]|jgi:hypothetical protein|nr:hypothetical protein [Mycobacterium sp.]